MTCTKRSYPSKKVAKKALKSARGRSGEVPVRLYKCEKCGEWHMTSKKRLPRKTLPWT